MCYRISLFANTRGSPHQDYGGKLVRSHVDQQKGQVEKQRKECPSWKLGCFKCRQLGHKVSKCQRNQRGALERVFYLETKPGKGKLGPRGQEADLSVVKKAQDFYLWRRPGIYKTSTPG